MGRVLSVSELTGYIRGSLESEELLQDFWVAGELSNYKAHGSGHHYFTLKDDRASIRGVMWKSRAQELKFRPTDGMKLLIRGSIGVYERDGNYQLYATQMQPEGLGSLYMAFEQLKARLQQEGLFDSSRKRVLPPFPSNVVVLTSPTGAAIRDILTVLERRYPQAKVLIIPVAVQGAEAVVSIVRAFVALKDYPETDVVIVGRGGGSLEELWSFNEEAVVRAIADCPYPVVSAVGHETDVTISDFVADLRAPTPSAAAEMIAPDRRDLFTRLAVLQGRMRREVERVTRQPRQRVDELASRLRSRSPLAQILDRKKNTEALSTRLGKAMGVRLAAARSHIEVNAAALAALSPLGVLARGYSVTRRRDGSVVTSSDQLNIGEELLSSFRKGQVTSVVLQKENRDEI